MQGYKQAQRIQFAKNIQKQSASRPFTGNNIKNVPNITQMKKESLSKGNSCTRLKIDSASNKYTSNSREKADKMQNQTHTHTHTHFHQHQQHSISQSVKLIRANHPLNPPLSDYLHSQSPTLSGTILSQSLHPLTRKLTVQWLIEVAHELSLKKQTLFLAVHLFDVMLERESGICCQNLQLLAITVLFISGKYEEIYAAQLDKLLEYACFTFNKKEVIAVQQRIMAITGFKITVPTRYTFLQIQSESGKNAFLKQYDRNTNSGYVPKKWFSLCLYLLELSLLVQWQNVSEPSIASGCMFLASKILHRDVELPSPGVLEIVVRMVKLMQQEGQGVVAWLFDRGRYEFVGGTRISY